MTYRPLLAAPILGVLLLTGLSSRLAKAQTPEARHRRSLAIREQLFGREHPDVANSLKSLGNVYQREGRSAEALPLYERSLTIIEKSLGPERPQADYIEQRGMIYAQLDVTRELADQDFARADELRAEKKSHD